MEAPQAYLDKYKNHKGPGLNDWRYGAMIEAMDAAIGRLLNALDEMKVAEQTLVIFTSDNGAFGGVGDNRPLRQEKGFLYEGGIRVPLIVRWPGKVKAGTLCDVPTVSMDFYPTLLDAAGQDLAGLPTDGESLVPLLKGEEKLQREAIYFHYPNYAFHRKNRLGSAIRQGNFKLIHYYDKDEVELYDLSKDLSEKNNLASEMPDRAASLREQLQRWRKRVDAAEPELEAQAK